MKYNKRTVDEAVQLLDCYASQASWPTDELPPMSSASLARVLDMDSAAYRLACEAWDAVPGLNLKHTALEAAQRLREGWRP